ncbi:MAG: UDP-N-acetylenolpyruvoylglucosamine reductase, partial [Deltaproteobacteria bacterium]|nr:UDP-N-acetylenolpyruvoylglucosamine reductase [Deltaproteobacteria bacterium]
KGLRIGQAEVSRQHANFIINLGDATAKDVLTLIRQIRATVREQIGFELDCEVRYVSPDGCIYPAHLKAEDSV